MVTVTSGSSLGKSIVTPPPPTGTRVSSDEERFLSASSDGFRSNASSTYFSPTASNSGSRTLAEFTPATSATQVTPSSFASTYLVNDSGSEASFAPPQSSFESISRKGDQTTCRKYSSFGILWISNGNISLVVRQGQ